MIKNLIDTQLKLFREKFNTGLYGANKSEILKAMKEEIEVFIKDSMLAVEIEVKKEIEKDIKYYEERYEFNRNRAFSEFITMLNSVLIYKTYADNTAHIIKELIEEYNKLYRTEYDRAIKNVSPSVIISLSGRSKG